MIEIVSSRQDKFGFYQVGDFQTYSKFEAAEQQVKTGQKIHWNFNDAVYSSFDWTQEPAESLRELYRQRAQQLREQYDYLVLWFSGGADSTNILNSFVDNNIKLDEVASFVNYDATGDRFNYLNAEIYNVAVPRIQKIQQQQPWLVHSLLDISKMTMDIFSEKESKFNWIYHVNSYINPNAVSRKDIKLKNPAWTKMFDAGKKVGFIYGTDKPYVNALNGKYYLKFIDMIDNAVSADVQMMDRAWEFNELFYWSPSHPQIVIKQAHAIKNFLKSTNIIDSNFTNCPDSATNVATHINGKLYWLTFDCIHRLIYPGWYPVPYQGKPPSIIFTLRDNWFFNLPDQDFAKYSWRTGLEHLWKTSPNFLKKDPKDIRKGFNRSISYPYYLGD